MRVAVIVVWRPKNFPEWNGRNSEVAKRIPRPLADDAATPPFTGVHLAALFPRDWEVTVIHEMVRDVDLDLDVHAVFLSTMDFCAPHARQLAMEFRARGVKVIVGGLFPTLNPEYFFDLADTVVIGEAEPVINRLVADLKSNCLEKVYRAEQPADLSNLPVPRYDLMETTFQSPMSYEATRGCPFTCSYCVLSTIRLPYRRRPIPNVIRDVQAIPPGWSWSQRKYIAFWDNNLGADRRYFRELCEAMAPLKRIWGTQTSIDTITHESAKLMGKAGCRFVYIGLESLAQESLQGSNKRHNKVSEYRERIRLLHDNGVLIMSIFLVGLDGDTIEYLRDLPDLVADLGVDLPVFSFAAPIDGTPFHRDLREAGRLLSGDINFGLDGVHLVYEPKNLSADEVEMALFDCMRRANTPWRVLRRVARGVKAGLWPGVTNASANIFYRPHQLALARTGLDRIRERGPWPGNGFNKHALPDQPSLAMADLFSSN